MRRATKLGGKPEITRFKGLGEISPKEFQQFIGKQMRLSRVEYAPRAESGQIFDFYMGKNTPERKDYIMDTAWWCRWKIEPVTVMGCQTIGIIWHGISLKEGLNSDFNLDLCRLAGPDLFHAAPPSPWWRSWWWWRSSVCYPVIAIPPQRCAGAGYGDDQPLQFGHGSGGDGFRPIFIRS